MAIVNGILWYYTSTHNLLNSDFRTMVAEMLSVDHDVIPDVMPDVMCFTALVLDRYTTILNQTLIFQIHTASPFLTCLIVLIYYTSVKKSDGSPGISLIASESSITLIH